MNTIQISNTVDIYRFYNNFDTGACIHALSLRSTINYTCHQFCSNNRSKTDITVKNL